MKSRQTLYTALFLLLAANHTVPANPYYPQEPMQETTAEVLQYRQDLINRLRNEDGVQIVIVGDTLKIILGVDRFFLRNSGTRICAPKEPVLDAIAQLLLTYGNRRITVSGHTDNVGSDESKFKRSTAQANTIAGYLWSGGISLGNVTVLGCADTKPVASNRIVEGSAANRRVEIELDANTRPRYYK